MDIEVNEYVRTPIGIFIISHINIDFDDNDKNKCLLCQNEKVLFLSIETIKSLKHSKQLIDLIEVGDYVNGLEVEQVLKVREFKGFRGSKKFAFTHIKFSLPGGMIEDKEIRTILTKEQMEANCYKVGGKE